MRVASLKCRFTYERVREIPDVQGVFTLWDGKECVYVAHTPWNRSLQHCLREHLAPARADPQLDHRPAGARLVAPG